MYICLISAECAPVAKSGGLGDFVEGLAHELSAQGHKVEIILPKYDVMRGDRVWNLHKVHDIWAPYHEDWLHCDVELGQADGLDCLFIDPHAPQAFFQRGAIYGEADDAERFAFFSRAALELLQKTDRRPDVIHCQDWHTGLIPVLLKQQFGAESLQATGVCYTLHNLGYQGVCDPGILSQVGLDEQQMMNPEGFQDGQDSSKANLMKGGVVFADYVTTVSPRYAWEIQHTEQGQGLQETLRARADSFGGVLNGIDYEVWNPQTDPYIEHGYCDDTLQRKARNKHSLREQFGLEQLKKPIVAVVSRLEAHKGPELMARAARFCVQNQAQFVLLGVSQDEEINRVFRELKSELEPGGQCHIELAYEEEQAHRIFAGSDLLLAPSLYEPCGLTQMIAMRYGAVPVVRQVGGLADTVFDANYSDVEFEQRNGYVFSDFDNESMESALKRAIGLWYEHPTYFRQLRLNGMRQQHSWKKPATVYESLYRQVRRVGRSR